MTDLTTQLADLIVRRDDNIAPATWESLSASVDDERDRVVYGLWAAAPDADTLAIMVGVYDEFRSRHDLRTLQAATRGMLESFIKQAPDAVAAHLRRNSVVAALFAAAGTAALVDTGLYTDLAMPTITVHTGRPSRSTTAPAGTKGAAAMQRATSNDEVTLLRLAATSPVHPDPVWCAATVAVATSGAAPAELPAVTAGHLHLGPDQPALALTGRHSHDPRHGYYLAARTVALDPWSTLRLDTHLRARSDRGAVAADTRLLYTGLKTPDSASARISMDRMISRAVKAAGFRTTDQVTAGGLGLWRAAHTALHHGLDAGATVHGTDPLNLLRKLTHAADRSYRRT